jgi:hypothetical protein
MILVSVAPGDSPKATARLIRIDEAGADVSVRVDPATFGAPAPADASAEYVWTGTDAALLAVLGASAPLTPRRDNVTEPGTPKPPDDSPGITSKPWFWVIIGGVAALGLTAVIVSQTVDTSTGTVHLQGTVLP